MLAATDIQKAIYADGFAVAPQVLTAEQTAEIQAFWPQANAFRASIDMVRYNFGKGMYRYFADPLPPLIHSLRRRFYDNALPVANQMMQDLRAPLRYPESLEAFTAQCHAAGQTRPTPLLLRYEAGGYNRLHRDLYGPLHFPLQATILLSRPQADFTGGEFLLIEQQPRQQSIGRVVPLDLGDMVIFPVFERPAQGRRGFFKAPIRHGVSQIRTGARFALGLILHDAA